METIRGSVSYVIWPRQEGASDSFRIVSFKSQSGLQITAKGCIPSVEKTDTIELTGDWIDNAQYGRQFNVISSERAVPSTNVGIARFLAKEVAGIGPARARKIVDKFGSGTIAILAESPERLSEVDGINLGLARKIGQGWKIASNTSHKTTRIWLAGKGITDAVADHIIEKFGADTVPILTNDPYRSMEISRVGFKTADELAAKLGHPKDSMERLDAACIHILQKASIEEGHSCLWEDEALKRIRKVAGITAGVEEALDRVTDDGRLIKEPAVGSFREGNVIYLPSLHRAERILLHRLKELILEPVPEDVSKVKARALTEAQEAIGKELTPNQLQGVWQSLTQRISGITGPPGVGKSESVKVLVRAAELLGMQYLLLAPTGRAAKRLSEATGRPASTIHRALEYDPSSGECNRNSSRPLEADLVIMDEASMLELDLASKLFTAIPDNCSVVVIGDADQLPSVGPGTVLRDLIASGTIHFTVLDTIFRQARGSDIVKNAHRIRKGHSPTFPPKGVPTDCYLMDVGDKPSVQYIKDALRKLCVESIPAKTGLPTRHIQVLIPMKIGDVGTKEINIYLQGVLNDVPNIEGSIYRPGDRVIQTRNNYQLDVFNGDVGFVEDRDEESGGITVVYDDRKIVYTGEDLQDLQLCYASTIHRFQGGQAPVVIIIVLMKHFVMLNRNLLYTAASRARNLCVYLASRKALAIASRTDKADSRTSLLAGKLRLEIQNAAQ